MSNILKPNSRSRLWRMTRRKRPKYPSLKPGEQVDMERPECGRNVAIQTYTDGKPNKRRVTVGAFVFGRGA